MKWNNIDKWKAECIGHKVFDKLVKKKMYHRYLRKASSNLGKKDMNGNLRVSTN